MGKSKTVSFRTKIGLLTYLPGMHYLEIPARIVEELGGGFKRRLICTVNKKLSFACGLMSLGQGKAYISITKSRLKTLGLREGSPAQVTLKPDSSKYGMPVSKELAEVLKQDPEAKTRFDQLTPGKQRNIIHYVGAVKNPDLRIERAFTLLENLKKLPPGKERMGEMMRGPGQKGDWDDDEIS